MTSSITDDGPHKLPGASADDRVHAVSLILLVLGSATVTGQTVPVERAAAAPKPGRSWLQPLAGHARELSQEPGFRTASRAADARWPRPRRPSQIAERQKKLKAFFLQSLGDLPERTPLNPRIVGTRQYSGYRIERVIFESRPGHEVTASLYLPEGKPPFPGVLVPCGHSANGKAADIVSAHLHSPGKERPGGFLLRPDRARRADSDAGLGTASRPSERVRRPSTRWRVSARFWLAARPRLTAPGMESGPLITWRADQRSTPPAWAAPAIRGGER